MLKSDFYIHKIGNNQACLKLTNGNKEWSCEFKAPYPMEHDFQYHDKEDRIVQNFIKKKCQQKNAPKWCFEE